MRHVSDTDFDAAVLRAHRPMLVHFAGPGALGRQAETRLEGLADRLGARMRIARIELEANPVLAVRYAVATAPSLVYFRDGQAVARKSGASVVEDDLEDWVRTLGIGCACHPD